MPLTYQLVEIAEIACRPAKQWTKKEWQRVGLFLVERGIVFEVLSKDIKKRIEKRISELRRGVGAPRKINSVWFIDLWDWFRSEYARKNDIPVPGDKKMVRILVEEHFAEQGWNRRDPEGRTLDQRTEKQYQKVKYRRRRAKTERKAAEGNNV